MNTYDKLRISLRYWLLGKGYYKAVDALEFAGSYHTGYRKDGVTPEFEHQVRITHYLRSLNTSLMFPEETLAASLLHDVVEDHPVPVVEIYHRYGEQIGIAVDLLTKTKGKDTFQYYQQMVDNPVASIVKGGDRIHNVQTMQGVFNYDKQLRYCNEVVEYILPMLRNARRKFPQQEPAYENIKHMLNSQIELVREIGKQTQLELASKG
jgi:(p)ppGpp synthase/HD superfamily hydrolase